MHKQGLICPCLFLIKNTTQVCANICSSVLAEEEAEQLPRVSAAALDTDGETTMPLYCPRKKRANKKEKYNLEARKKNKYYVFQKSSQSILIHKFFLDRTQRRAINMAHCQSSSAWKKECRHNFNSTVNFQYTAFVSFKHNNIYVHHITYKQ